MRRTILIVIHFSLIRHLRQCNGEIPAGSQNASVATKLLWHDYTKSSVDGEPLSHLFVYDESEDMVFGTPVLWHKKLTETTPEKNHVVADFERIHSNESNVGQCLMCPEPPKFRMFDGSCNNCHRPRFGKAHTPFVRLLAPTFYNGIDSMPRSVTGYPLPLVRELSTEFFKRRNVRSWSMTLAVALWGQMLAHDFARFTIRVHDEYIKIKCCTDDGRYPLTEDDGDRSCVFILIPEDDSFYSRYGQRCMNFVRSLAMVKASETRLPIQHPNSVSSFLDLSPVYGSDNDTANSLRTFTNGMLKTENRFGRIVMPTVRNESAFCDIDSPDDVCFQSGDYRVNQNPHIVILHTLFVREHNRIAGTLHQLNPHWDDERVFQESRRIVIAEYQHITYREWLPLIIDDLMMYKERENSYLIWTSYGRRHGLETLSDITFPYSETVNPGTMSSFTSSAFRFLHSMIAGNVKMYSPDRWARGDIRLSDYFFRPGIIEKENNFEDLLRGFVTQRTRQAEARFDEEITEFLFRAGKDFGMDLVAIDIKRSRDHGVPGYNAHRELCGFGRATDFNDLRSDIQGSKVRKLEMTYDHVDDIDLYIGVALEKPIDDGLIGPTARCIIAEQFYRTRVGDKYFYDNLNSPYPFTTGQLTEIRRTTFSRILCEAGEQEEMQEEAFIKKSAYQNPLLECRKFPKLNMNLWKDHQNAHEQSGMQGSPGRDDYYYDGHFRAAEMKRMNSNRSRNKIIKKIHKTIAKNPLFPLLSPVSYNCQ